MAQDNSIVVYIEEDSQNEFIPVTHEIIWCQVELDPQYTHRVSIDLRPGLDMEPKQSLIVFEFRDQNGLLLEHENRFPEGKIGHFVYLPNKSGEFSVDFTVPDGTSSTRLGFRLWHAPGRELQMANSLRISSSGQGSTDFDPRLPWEGKIAPDEAVEKKVALTKDPLWVEVSVKEHMDLELALMLTAGAYALGEKSAILWTQFLDAEGSELPARVGSNHGKFGPFNYINIVDSGMTRINVFTPAACVRLRFGLAAWKAKPNAVSVDNLVTLRAQVKSPAAAKPPSVRVQTDFKSLLLDPDFVNHTFLSLSTSPLWLRVAVKEESDLKLSLQINARDLPVVTKAGLLRVRYLSETGEELTSRLPMKSSSQYGQYFYIDLGEADVPSYLLAVPSRCSVMELGLQTFDAAEGSIHVMNQVGLGTHKARTAARPKQRAAVATFPSQKSELPLAREVKVALVCDEFSYNSFSYEFEPIIIEPATWRETFALRRPDIFLCESAWSGVDSNTRPWKGRVYASENFPTENRTDLIEILEFCRINKIPTVFWNKEDPTHFGDRVHDFVKTAKLFDHVFTTDKDMLPLYSSKHQIENVDCLPFATQPRLFNPINGEHRTPEVVFAGSWYENHKARSIEMKNIFDSILEADLPLVIYDRYFGTEDSLHKFPQRFDGYRRPAVTHAELAEVYKSSIFGLNINTVTESSSMFARRVFELMSSNTLVLSNYSAGVVNLFGDNVVILEGNAEELSRLTDEHVEHLRDENLHSVLEEHTYRHRFLQILDTIGFKYQRESESVTLVGIVQNRDAARELVSRFRFYNELSDQLLIVLDDKIPNEEISSYYADFNRHGITVVSKALWRDQPIREENLVYNSHFVIVDAMDFPTKLVLKRALLHRSYIDEPIVFGSGTKYVFTPKAILKNLIAERSYLEKAVMSYGTETRGNFYHV